MFKLLCVTSLLTFCIYSIVAAGNVAGYHYEKPTVTLSLVETPSNVGHGHSFGPLPTVQPLPPVPALPPLPTPRSKGQFLQTRTIYQTHPVATLKPLTSSYESSASSNIGKIVQQYQPPLVAQHSSASSVKAEPTGTGLLSSFGGLDSNLPNPAPAAAQPLRVPFGKQAVIGFPFGAASEASYEAHGRQLKQYAVIEIIDNDIEQNTRPFLSSPFFDNYRAHTGASGEGASRVFDGGIQLEPRSSATVFGQQRIASQASNNDAVALGSGGLGFIRLANGNVYLGSGSLGYISGQQHNHDIHEARTRSGAPQPDALHFGHGPLGSPNRFNKFSYRFN